MAAKWRELGLSDREAMLKAQMEYEQDRARQGEDRIGHLAAGPGDRAEVFRIRSRRDGNGDWGRSPATGRRRRTSRKPGRCSTISRHYDTSTRIPTGSAHGRRTGVMAQDLEKSRLGKGMVHKTADGVRIVDYNPTTFNPIALAALADLNGRLKALEGGKR